LDKCYGSFALVRRDEEKKLYNVGCWSPSGKARLATKPYFETPPKILTPKVCRLASPASQPQTPTSVSKLKLRRNPKVSLFSAENSISETDSDKWSKKERDASKCDDDKSDPRPIQETAPTVETSPVRTLRSKSEKVKQEINEAGTSRIPTIISFSKTSSTASSGDDDELGRKILEMSSRNRQLQEDSDVKAAGPSASAKLKLVSSPTSRTPKRLRSKSKNIRPNSKRRRVSIEYFSDPPEITDTSACGESKKRKAVEIPGAESETSYDDTSAPKSPASSYYHDTESLTASSSKWSVTTYESPLREIKVKFFKKKRKPEESPCLLVNRISRRMTNDTGLSPEVLNKLMYQSPSPKKKRQASTLTATEKENDATRDSSTSAITSETLSTPRLLLRKLDTNQSVEPKPRFSPLTSRGLVALTTSPIIDKKDGPGRFVSVVHRNLV